MWVLKGRLQPGPPTVRAPAGGTHMALASTVDMGPSSLDGNIHLGAYVTFPNSCDFRRAGLKDTWALAPLLCLPVSVMPSCSFPVCLATRMTFLTESGKGGLFKSFNHGQIISASQMELPSSSPGSHTCPIGCEYFTRHPHEIGTGIISCHRCTKGHTG